MLKPVKITVCDFKRTKDAPFERGVAFGEVDFIVDASGQTLPHEPHDFWLRPNEGCMWVQLGEGPVASSKPREFLDVSG
jgi:hypothetical protein